MSRVQVAKVTVDLRASKPARQKGWAFETTQPPNTTHEQRARLDCTRLQRAVNDFFWKNKSRSFFVANVTMELGDSPGASELLIFAYCSRYRWYKAPKRDLWIYAVSAEPDQRQFYETHNDEETARFGFEREFSRQCYSVQLEQLGAVGSPLEIAREPRLPWPVHPLNSSRWVP